MSQPRRSPAAPSAPSAGPAHVHVVPVGTSILTNMGWRPGEPLPDAAALGSRVERSPRAAAAELNALLPFIERGECTTVHLLHTPTGEAAACAAAIAEFLRARGVSVTGRPVAVRGLSADAGETEFFQGIRRFREAVFRIADRAAARGDRVYINATGGLKAQAAVAALVAAELGVPAYFMHERMRMPVYLPTAALDAGTLTILRRCAAPAGTRLPEPDASRLEREGLATVQRRADGSVSRVKPTAFGRHILNRHDRR